MRTSEGLRRGANHEAQRGNELVEHGDPRRKVFQQQPCVDDVEVAFVERIRTDALDAHFDLWSVAARESAHR